MDVWNAEPFQRSPARPATDAPEPIVTLCDAGCTWDVFERSRSSGGATPGVSYTYLPRERDGALEIPIAQRSAQLIALARAI